jgi:2-phosphoglycolate phosphatase
MYPHAGHAAPKLVLFDLDGTLADTFKDLFWALNQALGEFGHGHADARAIRMRVSQGARAMSRAALADDSADLDAVVQRFLALYEQHVATRTTLFEGIEQVLTALEHSGIEYGVVTNKLARFSEPLIDRLQLRSRLRCLVSGDTAAKAKPHPEPLQLAAQLCNVPVAQCVYIGDARNDVIAARAARMRVAVATYGYLGADDDPRYWHADALIAQPSQLGDWLKLSPDARGRAGLPHANNC